ncbi:T9SS sorting signal type C domain-containing protein, partial [Winogradskyella poriferorum]|uniref:T9SS sorting signal type C domain-containing protein n=1 Tax=Winogradskyella poriferorum TaxID=307627 RepID=UPI003D6608E0
NDQVPIGLNISESGIQTLAINTLQGLFNNSNQEIYIEDLLNDTIHNIKESPYSFTSESGIINDRFILRFTNTTLGLDDFDTLSGISVFEDNDKITVKSDYGTIASIDVYDILGRTLYFNKSVNASRFSIESISPNNATLLLKIKLADGKQKIAKIIF